MSKKGQDVLVSGKTSFKVEVPYLLTETGEKGAKKPLIIYLHGFGENLKNFREKFSGELPFDAYHLFIQGPYPLYDRSRKKNVSEWGRAWYLYDGNRGQFIKSLELASEFIQEVTDKLLQMINVSRICVIGYSMGGYVAGYFALTRWKHVNELIVAGARIKTEVVNEQWEHLKHLRVLALHGTKDDSVRFEPQQSEIETFQSHGLNADLKLLDENHSFTKVYIEELTAWLRKVGYS
ncbi:MAG: alpha/beta fold hydrolase [Balneolaceae bacterium]|nr:alpha/beta fold hydrolase [Balneolaceae bacterium]MCH8547780.1 alpha/beta fold hydrolase [Balneolaceae bacterium]